MCNQNIPSPVFSIVWWYRLAVFNSQRNKVSIEACSTHTNNIHNTITSKQIHYTIFIFTIGVEYRIWLNQNYSCVCMNLLCLRVGVVSTANVWNLNVCYFVSLCSNFLCAFGWWLVVLLLLCCRFGLWCNIIVTPFSMSAIFGNDGPHAMSFWNLSVN